MEKAQTWYIAILLVIFGGIVLHAPLTVWLGTVLPEQSLVIKAWKEILLVLLIIIGVIIASRKQLWRELSRDWIFRLIIAYAMLHILLLVLFWQGVAATLSGLAIDLRFIAFFGLTYLFFRLWPEYRRVFVLTGIAGAWLVTGFAVLQVFVLPPDVLSHIGYGQNTIQPHLTVDKNTDFIRINSTMRGPNPLGAYLVIVLAAAAAFFTASRNRKFIRERWGAAILAILGLVALWSSYSRSAWGATIIALSIVFGVVAFRRLSKRALATLLVAGIILVGLFASIQNSDFISHVIRHENPSDISGVPNSDDEHFQSLQTSFGLMLQQPLGAGIGSTGSASLFTDTPKIIENQYLFIAHETGWLGLGLFLAIFGLVLKRLWRHRTDWLALAVFASGVGLALIGLLLPAWVDDTVALVWWGLAGLLLGVHDATKLAR